MENFIIANCTDTGRTRTVNEDCMASFDSPNGRVVVVCDGMGGQNAGDVASSLAVTVIQDILTDNTFASPEEAINRSIFAANQAILRRAAQDINLSGMGSTCVMIIINNGQVYYGSVGDSRIYYIVGGTIRQITKDQSYVQTLVDEGAITQEAAEHHQDKNQITNALGLESMTAPVIGQMPIIPEPGSVFLLCSDGLSGMINNNAILNTVKNSHIPLEERALQLVNMANAAGGLDNITVQLVEFYGSARPQTSPAYPLNGTSGGAFVPKMKKSRLPLLFAIVCLLLIIFGGVGAYMYFQKQNQKTPIPSSTVKEKKKEVPAKEQPKETIVVKETIVTQEKESTPKANKKRTNNPVENLMKRKINKPSKEDPQQPEEELKNIIKTDNSAEKNLE